MNCRTCRDSGYVEVKSGHTLLDLPCPDCEASDAPEEPGFVARSERGAGYVGFDERPPFASRRQGSGRPWARIVWSDGTVEVRREFMSVQTAEAWVSEKLGLS